jgi:hypothetical protein
MKFARLKGVALGFFCALAPSAYLAARMPSIRLAGHPASGSTQLAHRALLCPTCTLPMTQDEADEISNIVGSLLYCGDGDCAYYGASINEMNWSFSETDWECFNKTCVGESDGNGNGYISRQSSDVHFEASTAFHEAIHTYGGYGEEDEDLVLAIEAYCEDLISWWS